MQIVLENNRGFKWYNSNTVFVKGYLYDSDGNNYTSKELISYFQGIDNFIDFNNKLANSNGCFAVVISDGNKIFAGVDRLRSIPLFYYKDNDHFVINDCGINNQNQNVNKLSVEEFRNFGYVTGRSTLFSNLYQLQAGESVTIEKSNIKQEYYYRHLKSSENKLDYLKLTNQLESISSGLFDRLISSLNGKTAILPLSAGYDSRYIACMLKIKGYDEVICFSYGKRSNKESEISEDVAKALGYRWIFVEYSDQLIEDVIKNDLFDYYKYSANNVSLPHIQDLFAVKYMKEHNLIPDDSIFIPGHSADLLAGSHLRTDYKIFRRYNINNLTKATLSHHSFNENVNSDVIKRVDNFFKELPSSIKSLDVWNVENRQSKFIVNSLRVYEYFGYEWRIPLWDKELTDFFWDVPLKYKIFTVLYNEFLNNKVFSKFGLQKPSNINIFKVLIKSILPDSIIQKIEAGVPKGDPFNFKYRNRIVKTKFDLKSEDDKNLELFVELVLDKLDKING